MKKLRIPSAKAATPKLPRNGKLAKLAKSSFALGKHRQHMKQQHQQAVNAGNPADSPLNPYLGPDNPVPDPTRPLPETPAGFDQADNSPETTEEQPDQET